MTTSSEDSRDRNELVPSLEDRELFGEKFEKQFINKIDIKILEDLSKKLDEKFNVLIEFTRKSEKDDCDLLLFKNVYFLLTQNRKCIGILWIFRMSFENVGMLCKFSWKND